MRTFIISIFTFSLLLLLIVWNMIFVNRAMDQLEREILALPACKNASGALEQAEALWCKKRTVLSLSVSYSEIRDLDVIFSEMRAAVSEGDTLQFETARLKSLGAIDDIRRLERITPSSIA